MVMRLYRKNFTKFEIKKRAKLGDKVFLEKYICRFTRTNKSMKVCLPILLILNPVNAVSQIIFFIGNPYDNFRLFSMIAWSFVTLFWMFNALPAPEPLFVIVTSPVPVNVLIVPFVEVPILLIVAAPSIVPRLIAAALFVIVESVAALIVPVWVIPLFDVIVIPAVFEVTS